MIKDIDGNRETLKLQGFLYFLGLKLVPSFYHSIFLNLSCFFFGSMLKVQPFLIFVVESFIISFFLFSKFVLLLVI